MFDIQKQNAKILKRKHEMNAAEQVNEAKKSCDTVLDKIMEGPGLVLVWKC